LVHADVSAFGEARPHAERARRPGRRAKLPRLRRDYDQKWELLPVYELWEHEWVQLDQVNKGFNEARQKAGFVLLSVLKLTIG